MPPDCAHFKLADFLRPGENYHFASLQLGADDAARYHDHDYHEVFWITGGRGEHLFNGETSALEAGSLHLIHPNDRHRVAGVAAKPLALVNLAFPSRRWGAVRRRYFAGETDCFERPAAQRVWPIDVRAQARLAHWAERLAAPGRPRVALDGFLMELPQLRHAPAAGAGDPLPEWLVRAQREIARPEHFAGGTPELARLAGRTPSHVARATLRWLGKTPTDLVNNARLAYSAQELTTTARPILEIALDCGLTNLSHFYALFRKRFGVSPQRYRRRFRRIV
jgi:AraC family cel operon transcriptional repressor